MLKSRKVTIVGAGVAGLALGRALALRGAEVDILEQADAIREVGAGLQISPNGARVLHALGLGDALAEAGPEADGVEIREGETGAILARLDLARRGEFRLLHRARLIDLLSTGAAEAGVTVRLRTKIAGVDTRDGRPVLRTEDGHEESPDLLIGADGLHSRVRVALNGPHAPFFTHQVAWRGVIPVEDNAPAVPQVYVGPGRHLVSYPLGHGLRNVVAIEERRRWVEESWYLRDDPAHLRDAFRDFCPRVQGWLERMDEPWLWGLFRHAVAARWHGEGMAILGDAAHPTLPFLAQGAVMALEDAWVMADCLARYDTDAAALTAYQNARAPRCRALVEAANRNARNYHLSGMARRVAHAALRTAAVVAPNQLLGRFDWVYTHDVTAPAPLPGRFP